MRNISIELRGEQSTSAFFPAMSRYFELIRRGELMVCLGVTSRDNDSEYRDDPDPCSAARAARFLSSTANARMR